MAPVLVATLAGANSNSYITVANATTYFDNRLDAADWTAASADNKAASLITATGLARHTGVLRRPLSHHPSLEVAPH
jgi:hypothetical protein